MARPVKPMPMSARKVRRSTRPQGGPVGGLCSRLAMAVFPSAKGDELVVVEERADQALPRPLGRVGRRAGRGQQLRVRRAEQRLLAPQELRAEFLLGGAREPGEYLLEGRLDERGFPTYLIPQLAREDAAVLERVPAVRQHQGLLREHALRPPVALRGARRVEESEQL